MSAVVSCIRIVFLCDRWLRWGSIMLILHIRIVQYWRYLPCSLYQTCLVHDIAHQCPDIFQSHVPNTCLAATCAAVSVWVCLHYKCIWHHLLNRSTVYWMVMWGMVLERGSWNSRWRHMCQYTMLCFRWSKKHWGTLTMALVLCNDRLACWAWEGW